MRTKAFLKNGIIILIVQTLNFLMDFLNRTAVIYLVSIDYVGIKGLCNNILSILSLTDLGISAVIIYSMYKPLAKQDTPRLLALVGFYRKAYYAIAGLICVAGLIITPFFPYFIKDCPDISGIYIIFLLYLANSVFSYLFIYKASLLDADQKMYIRTVWLSVFHVLRNAAQILCLFLTGNFILYLIIQLPFTLIANLVVSRRAEQEYPFLKTKKYPPLSKEDTITLKKNTFAMFNHQVGNTILNSTDNLIISRFIGITAVAVNDNYVLIVNTIDQIMHQIFFALITSVGNLNATAPKEALYKVFKILHFADFWFYAFCTNCLLLLINPFIALVWGEQYLFPLPVVLIICLNFFIKGMRKIPLVFRDSMGLLWYDRYKPAAESVLNLILSVIAVQYFGAAGVFAGTLLAMLFTSVWIEPYILFKYGFQLSLKEFWITSAKYCIIFFFITVITYFTGTLYQGWIVYELAFRLIICLLLPNLILLILFYRSSLFRELLSNLSLKKMFQKENK